MTLRPFSVSFESRVGKKVKKTTFVVCSNGVLRLQRTIVVLALTRSSNSGLVSQKYSKIGDNLAAARALQNGPSTIRTLKMGKIFYRRP